MADISKIKVSDVIYDVKDVSSREAYDNITSLTREEILAAIAELNKTDSDEF